MNEQQIIDVRNSASRVFMNFPKVCLLFFSSLLCQTLTGAPAAVRPPSARGGGDEAGPDLARLRTVPQDLHPEARERQVRSRSRIFIFEACCYVQPVAIYRMQRNALHWPRI